MTTGSTGGFSFTGLPAGDYAVNTTATNFVCASASATVVAHLASVINVTCTPQPGSIGGTVRLDLVPRQGVIVVASQGATAVGSATSGSNGTYSIANLPPGAYAVGVTPFANSDCAPEQLSVTVQSNQATTVNFECTTPPGSVSGTVLVNGSGQAGVSVTLTQGANTIGTATTGTGGAYTIANVAAGSYSAAITPPAGTVCANTPQNVTVQANQNSTANFSCATDFSVSLIDPAPSYRHIVNGVSAETCTGISTTPARAGGTWTTTWTGPGTVGVTQRTGSLDASGKAVDRQPINQVGTYNLNVSVIANGVTRTATGTVVVTAAAGTCPP